MSKAANKQKRKKSTVRELVEWGLLLGIPVVLYLTGYHVEVMGFVQRTLLQTGIMQASVSEEGARLGKPEPASYAWQWQNEAGEVVDMGQYKGKTIFLNLWATWCPPCVAEMPDINSLYEEVGQGKEDIVFAMVSLDKDFAKAKAFKERKGFSFPIFSGIGAMPKVYATSSIPTTIVVSPEGQVVYRHEGMASYNTRKFKAFLAATQAGNGVEP